VPGPIRTNQLIAPSPVGITDVIVRGARSNEYAEWRELWIGYNAFYGRAGDTTLPEELNQLTWQRLHSPDEPMALLVASDGARLLGFAHVVFHRSTIAKSLACYLQDLFVVPEGRRRGIAGSLIRAAACKARTAHCPKLYWQTHESNLAARKLYDRVAEHRGFIVYDLRF
jgi:GNAT superfamily N-acetyltransferase